MKGTSYSCLLAVSSFLLFSCSASDLRKDVDELNAQVKSIEAQVELLNSNVEALYYIMNPQNQTVESVTPLGDKYVLSLSNGEVITLQIGQPGTIDQPNVVVGDDGMWYVNGEPTGVRAVGVDGKNGDGFPEFRVHEGSWQVRFGGGDWTAVPGGENVAPGSVGDQFFESAEYDAQNNVFKVVLTDGKEYLLPVVASLECAIDKSSISGGVVSLANNSFTEILLKAVGEEVVCYVPQGWRAVLTPLETADAKGNNYSIKLYSPVTKAVLADNGSDFTVCVRKGSFWAVDSLKLQLH